MLEQITTYAGAVPDWEQGQADCMVESGYPTMLCWLDQGHEGDHWDQVDQLWWRLSSERTGPTTMEERAIDATPTMGPVQ